MGERLYNARAYIDHVLADSPVEFDTVTVAIVLIALENAALLNDPGPDPAAYHERVKSASLSALKKVTEP